MFNNDLKKNAVHKFEDAKNKYEALCRNVEYSSKFLMEIRRVESNNLINKTEELFSKVANKPKVFDKTFAQYKAEFKEFQSVLDDIHQQSIDVNIKAGGSAGAGVAAGVGVASFAPTAAMAIATTFGTASTGTAISALSGAAATNAALAWLGGGALAVGGGGMASGSALLALAGPVGWAIGGTAIAGSAIFASRKNKKIAEEANEKTRELIVFTKQVDAGLLELKALTEETKQHINGLKSQLEMLQSSLKSFDYAQMNSSQKELMIAIKNHVESLSMLIKKKIVL